MEHQNEKKSFVYLPMEVSLTVWKYTLKLAENTDVLIDKMSRLKSIDAFVLFVLDN